MKCRSSQRERRDFLATSACGLGTAALHSLLSHDSQAAPPAANPYQPKPSHRVAQAKACIFLNMGGGTSQMDLFDPKPLLSKRHQEPLPPSFYTDKTLFSNLDPKTATLLGSPWKFGQHGECGMEMSELLPHLSSCVDDIGQIRSVHTDEFNHQQATVMLFTGKGNAGRPSVGSWVAYGLGSESQQLPAYVVLGGKPSGGFSTLSSGLLPTAYNGVPFRQEGSPIVNLRAPQGISRQQQLETVDGISRMNRHQYELVRETDRCL